jgi:hypothetical protein
LITKCDIWRFDGQPGEDAAQPAGERPVGRPEEVHQGGHQQAADEQGVDEHGEPEPEAEFLQDLVVAEQERAEEGGPPPPAARGGTGHGLIGMRERPALFGGELSAGPHADGFRVRASLPTAEFQGASQ